MTIPDVEATGSEEEEAYDDEEKTVAAAVVVVVGMVLVVGWMMADGAAWRAAEASASRWLVLVPANEADGLLDEADAGEELDVDDGSLLNRMVTLPLVASLLLVGFVSPLVIGWGGGRERSSSPLLMMVRMLAASVSEAVGSLWSTRLLGTADLVVGGGGGGAVGSSLLLLSLVIWWSSSAVIVGAGGYSLSSSSSSSSSSPSSV